MGENKLAHSIGSAIASWIALGIGWFESHVAFVASMFAIGAAVYSIWASKETIKLRRAEQKRIKDERSN